MRLIAAMTLALLVATGCYRERANNAEAQLGQMQAELRRVKEQVKRAMKACQPAPPASKGTGIDDAAIENCVMRMIARDGGSPREWRRACESIGR